MYISKDLENVNTILTGERGELWLYDNTIGDQRYKCYSEDTSLMRQVNSWDGAEIGATYSRTDGVMVTYDVVIPRRLARRACEVLGIPFGKDKAASERAKQNIEHLKAHQFKKGTK